jgi:hypothetical protein
MLSIGYCYFVESAEVGLNMEISRKSPSKMSNTRRSKRKRNTDITKRREKKIDPCRRSNKEDEHLPILPLNLFLQPIMFKRARKSLF